MALHKWRVLTPYLYRLTLRLQWIPNFTIDLRSPIVLGGRELMWKPSCCRQATISPVGNPSMLGTSALATIAILVTLFPRMDVAAAQAGRSGDSPWKSPIVKRGYLGSPLVEVTPLSRNGELYLLENWRSRWKWPGSPDPSVEKRAEIWMAHLPGGPQHYERREYLGRVMIDCTLGTAIVWQDRIYVYAVSAPSSGGGRQVYMASSEDMRNWSAPVKVFDSPAAEVFNVAVTRDDRGMVFLWETNGYGTPFTMCMGRIAQPDDPWNPGIIEGARYGMNKYTGGPALYYEAGLYYLLYLESLPGRGWETRIARSRNLKDWQDAPPDRPFVAFAADKKALPLRPPDAVENNASDAELCYHGGRALIYFTGGDQQYAGDLQWATYDGTLAELFAKYFGGLGDPPNETP